MKINGIEVRKILNSVGKPTIEATVRTKDGTFSASTAVGTSAGKHEFAPRSIDESIAVLKKIKQLELGSREELIKFEKTLEKKKVNSLSLIFAILKAFSASEGEQLWENLGSKQKPYLLHKIIGGGRHATAALPGVKSTEFQEFLIAVKTNSMSKNFGIASRVHQLVGNQIKTRYLDLEGGWVSTSNNEETLKLLRSVVDRVKHETGARIEIGVDVAASEFYKNGNYCYKTGKRSKSKQIDFIKRLVDKYNLEYVEDPLQEDDFSGFAKLTKATKVKICGDDLVTTNPKRLEMAHKKKALNTVIVKPNQIGYFYKLLDFVEIAKKYKYTLVMSHRSQETSDDTLADLCVGFGCKYMKIGLFGDERLSKIKRLFKIFGD